MANRKSTDHPFQSLGELLRSLREHSQETLADVSGAVEMDEATIKSYELGQERPSEDILLLLMNHFGVQEDKAAELWSTAGYEAPAKDERSQSGDEPDNNFEKRAQQTMMVMLDPRVMYTDGVEVFATDEGVVINFHQRTGVPAQPIVVSRVGMSREQARTFMGLLHKVLYDMDNPSPEHRLGDGKQ